MTTSHAIKFSMIADFFRSNNQQLKRGEIAYTDNHVMKMIFDGSVQPAMLKGQVQASMKNRKYDVEISIDSEDGIIAAACSCPRGGVICHHMAALCIYGHYNISSTDQACSWNAPKQSNVENIKLKEIFPSKKAAYRGTDRKTTQTERDSFLSDLGRNVLGFSWLLQPEVPQHVLHIVPQVEEILMSQEYLNSNDKTEFLVQKFVVTKEVISSIVRLTINQFNNENWLMARKHRLTASKFGFVLAACKRQRFPPSLFKNLVEGYDLSAVRAIQWGLENENAANEIFSAATELTVIPTGLWLHECGYLGASPDGLIGEDALLEIKCPYKFRDSLNNNLCKDKTYIIYKDVQGETKVNENHNYWHQIQGQLYITGRSKCYLMIWTPKECEIVIIPKSLTWEPNLAILKEFYLQKFIPYICGS